MPPIPLKMRDLTKLDLKAMTAPIMANYTNVKVKKAQKE
jgi:hypothetical protein